MSQHRSRPTWSSSLLWARSLRIVVLLQACSLWSLLEAYVLTKCALSTRQQIEGCSSQSGRVELFACYTACCQESRRLMLLIV